MLENQSNYKYFQIITFNLVVLCYCETECFETRSESLVPSLEVRYNSTMNICKYM